MTEVVVERSYDVGAGVTLVVETRGPVGGPPLVLVPGVGMQLVSWPAGMVDALVAKGFRVTTYDGRDAGRSTHWVDEDGADRPPYALADLAADLRGLLDALGIVRAHLLGVSMGGMVAQTLAISDPGRVASLTSMSSTTGARADTESDPAAAATLLTREPESEAEAAARGEAVARAIGSPGADPAVARERAVAEYRREAGRGGVARQWQAVMTRGQDRTDGLRGLLMPTLVVHGELDPLIGVRGGRATADAVPGAVLIRVPGMGHDLPPFLWPLLAGRVAAHVVADFEAFELGGWERKAAAYDGGFGRLTVGAHAALLDAAGVTAGTRVLDIGCGTGRLAAAALARGAAVTACDAVEGMARLATAALPGVRVEHATLPSLPFADGEFDAVVGAFVVNHLARPAPSIAELARVLRPGGRLALTTWDIPARNRPLGVVIDALASLDGSHAPTPDVPAVPFAPFNSADAFAGLLRDAGLADAVTETVTWTHATDEATWWDAVRSGTVLVASLLDAQDEPTLARVREAYDAIVAAELPLRAAALLCAGTLRP